MLPRARLAEWPESTFSGPPTFRIFRQICHHWLCAIKELALLARFSRLRNFWGDLASLVATDRHQLDMRTFQRCRICRAMEYIPESHKLDQIPHRDTLAKHNLLTRGQEVMIEVDHSRRRIITLRPGEMSLHHVRLVHGSPPDPSNDRRIGFTIRYIPTDVAQLAGEDSASL